jgi:hypothetical protein
MRDSWKKEVNPISAMPYRSKKYCIPETEVDPSFQFRKIRVIPPVKNSKLTPATLVY